VGLAHNNGGEGVQFERDRVREMVEHGMCLALIIEAVAVTEGRMALKEAASESTKKQIAGNGRVGFRDELSVGAAKTNGK